MKLDYDYDSKCWYSCQYSLATAFERLPRGEKLGMFTSHWSTERIACMGAGLSDIFNKVGLA